MGGGNEAILDQPGRWPRGKGSNAFAARAHLTSTAAPVAHRQHENLMNFAARTCRASLAVPHSPLHQAAAHSNSPVIGSCPLACCVHGLSLRDSSMRRN
jgi:hypothetical protein